MQNKGCTKRKCPHFAEIIFCNRWKFQPWPSFFPHANIPDEMKKGPVQLRADEEEGESESKVMNQIFGRLQHPKMRWDILKYIFRTSEAIFPYKGVFFTKVVKANIIAFIKMRILRPFCPWKTPPSKNVSPCCRVQCFTLCRFGFFDAKSTSLKAPQQWFKVGQVIFP